VFWLTPYFRLTSINPIFGDPPNTTNCFYSDAWLLYLTNCAGYVITNLFPPTCTNSSPPYYPAPILGTNFMTNACGFIILTNCGCGVLTNYPCTNTAGPYSLDPVLGPDYYTNACGFVVIGSGLCLNQNGPYYPAPQYGTNMFTNACGYIIQIYSAVTNYYYVVTSIWVTNNQADWGLYGSGLFKPIDTAYLIFTNMVPMENSSTNLDYTYITMINNPTAAANQVYHYYNGNHLSGVSDGSYTIDNTYPSPPGHWSLYHSGSRMDYMPNSASNPWGSWSSGATSFGGILITNAFLTTNWYWAAYVTNAWRFYCATSVVFNPLPSETISVTGSYSTTFYVTNIFSIPDTNTLYTASNGTNQVQFSETVIGGWYLDANGNIVFFGTQPTSASLYLVVYPPTSPPPTPPSTNSPPQQNCNGNYITCTIGGVRKYLIHGEQMYEEAHNLNAASGKMTSYLALDAAGNGTFYLFGGNVLNWSWTDTSYWTTSIPGDACSSDWYPPFTIF